ncbi:MAG: DUF3943 domain-containing protein [Proteobacteria bacterium]|nr:MAG: DUF3943 domain-containing protein [Pseudomonadota bacterium]
MRIAYLFVLLGFLCLKNYAYSQTTEDVPSKTEPEVSSEVEIPFGTKLRNFGGMYLVQWTVYYASQTEAIHEHGSWNNLVTNPFKPHFDKDHFNWNLGKHTLVGSYYYKFYRSQGYSRVEGFNWGFLSSLAFELTIETLTERPSYQDLYQTPVFGAILGMGTEKISAYFHGLHTFPTTVLGYIFNPFTLLPGAQYHVSWEPVRMDDKNALAVTVRTSF